MSNIDGKVAENEHFIEICKNDELKLNFLTTDLVIKQKNCLHYVQRKS